MKRQWFVMYFQTSDRRVSPIQTYVEVDVTISTFQLVGHAWLLLPSHWQLELMGYQHHRKQLGSHQPIHPPQPLVFFPWKPHSVAQILSRWHSRPYRRMAVATIFRWCLTLSVISAEEGLWVKHGCQGGMERSSVFQDKCLTDSLRILKEGSMLKWSYIYNTFISLSFVFSLRSSYPTLTGYHPYPFEEGEIFNAAFWPATGLQGSPAPGSAGNVR